MDGLEGAELQGVVAPLKFIKPLADKPCSSDCEAPPRVPSRDTPCPTHQRSNSSGGSEPARSDAALHMVAHEGAIHKPVEADRTDRLMQDAAEYLVRQLANAKAGEIEEIQ